MYLITAETVQELRYCLQNAIDAMRSTENPVTAIASGSELFLRFITLATLDTPVRLFVHQLSELTFHNLLNTINVL